MNRAYKTLIFTFTIFLASAGMLRAQSDEDSWVWVSSIELDVSMTNMLDPLTAVIVKCELSSSLIDHTAGRGYAVLYDDGPYDGEDVTHRVSEDIWLDRISFEPVAGLDTGNMETTVTVNIYGTKADFGFWFNGLCAYSFYKGEVGMMMSSDVMNNSADPIICELGEGDDDFYNVAYRCFSHEMDASDGGATYRFNRKDIEAEREATLPGVD